MERYGKVIRRMENYLLRQITHFYFCFPFGRPKGNFQATLSFLSKVSICFIEVMATSIETIQFKILGRPGGQALGKLLCYFALSIGWKG